MPHYLPMKRKLNLNRAKKFINKLEKLRLISLHLIKLETNAKC